jgi:hypothetical protein
MSRKHFYAVALLVGLLAAPPVIAQTTTTTPGTTGNTTTGTLRPVAQDDGFPWGLLGLLGLGGLAPLFMRKDRDRTAHVRTTTTHS